MSKVKSEKVAAISRGAVSAVLKDAQCARDLITTELTREELNL